LRLQIIDWVSVVGFFVVALGIGIAVSRQAGRSSADFFLSGRKMPWWLLGISMVATTFSTDTPNLVTDIVRQQGVAGNWVWWAFLLTGMLTAFVYARLWRRTGVLTDVEFYELRYSGRSAAFLRGFRALYLGVLFNVVVMAAVSLAAIKIGGVMLGLTPVQTLTIALLVTTVYSTLGGLRSVILTDFLLFIVAMFGSVAAAVVALRLPQVGGLRGLVGHPAVADKLSILPDFDFSVPGNADFVVAAFVVPLTVQWWAAWYPGAEPGGGGYVAQRMLAARNEDHAVGATVLFNAAHYALRPWPWILVALCSLAVFPDLASLQARFPDIPADKIGHDLAYPAMLTYLPHGLLGLVLASLIAAYMSTISTHLNWGSSYVVNDFYRRFIDPRAGERRLVLVGRISTIVMVVLAAALALALQNALQVFTLILQIGAGTGLLFLVRWFWWRINAWSEITAMVVSFGLALYFQFVHARFFPQIEISLSRQFLVGVAVTTVAWVVATLLTPPTDSATLREFCRLARPGGPGWRRVTDAAHPGGGLEPAVRTGWDVPRGLVCMISGSSAVYATLFATGHALYGRQGSALTFAAIAVISVLVLFRVWRRARRLDSGGSP
jgi:SSS family solute:Na+ symporter